MYAPANVGVQTLTIWARQNLQLLTPSQSGWRALSQMVLPRLHAVLKWDLLSDLPSLYGRRLCRTVPASCTGTTCPNICVLSKYLRPRIFPPFSGNFRRSLGADCSAPRTLTKEPKSCEGENCSFWSPLLNEPPWDLVGVAIEELCRKGAGLAHIFSPFSGIKSLSRLLSVLQLHFKFVHDHISCPNSTTTLLSP